MKIAVLPLVLVTSAAMGQSAPPPAAGAPQQAEAQARPPMPGPPIRKIESATHLSTDGMGAINGVRQLSDGRVLVNDGTRRRLLMLDSTLKQIKVVLDSAADTENAYGTALGGLIAYRGDSSLFIDRASYSMLVLDGEGRIARIRSVPTTSYLTNLTSGVTNPAPGIDASGRLVFRIAAKQGPPPPNLPSGAFYMPPSPDSAFVVRLDLNTRKYDTAGVVRIPKSSILWTQRPDGSISGRSMIQPFPTTDDWAILSDGTVAFVRFLDYRVDYVDDRNAVNSSAKLPFDWVRLTDDDKLRMADSIKKMQEELFANRYYFDMIGWVNMYSQQYPKDFVIPPTLDFPPGLPGNWVLPPGYTLPPNYERGPAVQPQVAPAPARGTSAASASTAQSGTAAGRGAPPPATNAPPPAAAGGRGAAPAPMVATSGMTTIPPMPTQTTTVEIALASVAPPEEWPDYKPPISAGAARGDADGNLWIRINPMRPLPGGPIYDVVNRQGELVDRVQLPTGYTLVGFGAGRVIYLSIREGTAYKLARVRLKS